MGNDTGVFAKQLHDLHNEQGMDVLRMRAKQVEALVASPGWEFLTGLVEERARNALDGLIPSHAADAVPTYEAHIRAGAFAGGLRQLAAASEAVIAFAERKQQELDNRPSPAGAGG